MQILSRSLSGSRLNAGAPAFVPKGLQIACSTSLPGRVQVSGFRPPALVQASLPVIPVIMPPPAVTETSSGTGVFVPLVVEQILEPSPSMDRGSVNDVPDGDDVLMASDQGGEIETGLGAAAGSVVQHCKSVVTEELKARIVKQVSRLRAVGVLEKLGAQSTGLPFSEDRGSYCCLVYSLDF